MIQNPQRKSDRHQNLIAVNLIQLLSPNGKRFLDDDPRCNLTLFNFISPTLATPGVSAAKLVDRCYHVGVVLDSVIIACVILTEYSRVTDRRTDVPC